MLLNEIKILEFVAEPIELTVEQLAEVARVQAMSPIRSYIPSMSDVESTEFIES